MMTLVDDHIETLQKELETERLARAELERELDLMQQFIRHAGHDLKTPITTLKTSIYLLQRKPEMAVPQRLQTMETQLDRMTNLVDAMGLMARLDGKTALSFNETDILAILKEALWDVKTLADEKQITVSISSPDNLPKLALNYEECKRAIVNLLDNAMRYSPDESSVEISVFEMHGYICIDIHDQGTGLSQDEVTHLFTRFYRGDAASSMGAGMSLAITKRIIDLHHGKIRVSSEEGEGSIFRVMFPIGE